MSMTDEDLGAEERQPDAPGRKFTEAEAKTWIETHGSQNIRLMAMTWGWSKSATQRFVSRYRGTNSGTDVGQAPLSHGTSGTKSEAADTPGPPEPDPNEFDFKRSECVLPLRTAVWAYIDDVGDLRISAEDARGRCDAELRINAEDIEQFLLTLNDIVSEHLGHCIFTGRAVPKRGSDREKE
jgi:hypothetical protein